jgi:hypothetical protein
MSGSQFKQLKVNEITFPVYKLVGKAYMSGSEIRVTDKRDRDTLVVNLSHPGLSIGEKRIHSLSIGEELYKLRRGVCSLSNMIKGNSNTLYIDSKCNLFNYVKSVTCPLRYYALQRVVDAADAGTTLFVEGMRTMILADRPPELGERWVIAASIGNGYLFMGYSYDKGEPSTVKI